MKNNALIDSILEEIAKATTYPLVSVRRIYNIMQGIDDTIAAINMAIAKNVEPINIYSVVKNGKNSQNH